MSDMLLRERRACAHAARRHRVARGVSTYACVCACVCALSACMQFYPPHINATTCCRKLVCSECFLQVQSLARSAPCPFCTAERFSVRVVGASALPATPIPVNVSAGAGGAKAAAAGAAPLPAAGIRVRALSEQSPASASVPAIARATVADRKALHTCACAVRRGGGGGSGGRRARVCARVAVGVLACCEGEGTWGLVSCAQPCWPTALQRRSRGPLWPCRRPGTRRRCVWGS